MASADVRMGLIIEGGHLKHPWVPSVNETDGMHFVTASRADRYLAAFLGLPLGQRCPWHENGYLEYLKGMRNAAVAAAMHEVYMPEADPMADVDAVGPPALKRPRRDMIEGLPSVMTLHIPAAGEVPAHAMKVLSAPHSNALLEFEATAANLDFLRRAVHGSHVEPTLTRPRRNRLGDVLEGFPNVSWNEQRQHLYCRFQTAKGRTTQQSRAAKRLDDEELWKQVCRHEAAALQALYDASVKEVAAEVEQV